MMTYGGKRTHNDDLNRFTQSAILIAGTTAVSLVIRQWCIQVLRNKSKGEASPAALFARALKTPSLLWCLTAAMALATYLVDFSDKELSYIRLGIASFLIVSLTLVAASAAIQILAAYGRGQNLPIATAGMSRALIRVPVFGIGLVALLRVFGMDVTPMLTALGVGGLAVALALKDTLENFFAGLHIMVETPISVGDFIRLAPEEEGTVTDIGWRTTRLLTTSNSTIVVPNSKITSGILVNFNQPGPKAAVSLPVCVSSRSDHNLVRKLVLEAALSTEGVLADPAPIVLADPGWTPTHLELKLVIWCERRLGSGLTKSAVAFRILDSLAAAGVEPASPPAGVK